MTRQKHHADLTPTVQEIMLQMAAIQAELAELKAHAGAVSTSHPHPQPPEAGGPRISATRRTTIKRLGLALLGGAAAATVLGQSPVQAKVIANPQANGLANRAGMLVLPPGAAAPTGTAPAYTYGLIANGDVTALDLNALPPGNTGIYGNGSYYGVYGSSADNGGIGVNGTGGYAGVYGSGASYGVSGISSNIGVAGSGTTYGVYGSSIAASSTGVYGSGSGTGSTGVSGSGVNGVKGTGSFIGVTGVGTTPAESYGVFGQGRVGVTSNGSVIGVVGNGASIGTGGFIANGSPDNQNLAAVNSSVALFANAGYSPTITFGPNTNIGLWVVAGTDSPTATARTAVAAVFTGPVYVYGTLTKSGGSFKIDHPLDPENKYLYHSFVESPDMMNIYNGLATLDNQGEATVTMPDWFEALNSDFRYQLTCLGRFAPVYIAEEIKERKFRIAGGQPNQKVSWQVTGIRQDAWAKANRIPVEEDKAEYQKGRYLHPEVHGKSDELKISL